MLKTILDLHGFTVEEALKEVEQILFYQWRLGLESGAQVEIITGRGKIKKALIEYLKKQKIDFYIPMGNAGMIVIS
jgi:DNA-nicking Smr family endonuclease